MTSAQLTFVETFVALLAACLLSFWGGRVSRDKEVEQLDRKADLFESRANSWIEHSESLSQNRDDWKDRALAAEAQLASLPTRGAHGRFEKRAS